MQQLNPPKYVLVVDDEPGILTMLGNALTLANYRPVLASSGKEAIAAVREATPDLIIMDVMMAEMDGLTCLQELWSSGYQGPVILITAMPPIKLQEELTRLRGHGSVDHVFIKPLVLRELHKKMTELFRKEEAVQCALDSRGEGWYLQRILPIPEIETLHVKDWQGWIAFLIRGDGKRIGYDMVTYYPHRLKAWNVQRFDDLPGLG